MVENGGFSYGYKDVDLVREVNYSRLYLSPKVDDYVLRKKLFPVEGCEAIQERQERIIRFAQEHNYPIDDYIIDGFGKLSVIDSLSEMSLISSKGVEKYLN